MRKTRSMHVAEMGEIHSPFPSAHSRNALMERFMGKGRCRTQALVLTLAGTSETHVGDQCPSRHGRARGPGGGLEIHFHCPIGLGLCLQGLFPTSICPCNPPSLSVEASPGSTFQPVSQGPPQPTLQRSWRWDLVVILWALQALVGCTEEPREHL